MEDLFDNKYKYVKELGRGGLGRVFLAKDMVADRFVAIKQLKDTSKDKQKELIHEIKIIAKLNSPNIVNFYHHFTKDEVLYLVMEYCEKGNLRLHLTELRSNPTKVLDYITTLTHALEAVHAAGFAHNDLKPENIVVTAGGVLKLADFGLANLHGGTLAYMTPEALAFNERKPNDVRADTYALTLIMLELLTWANPFQYKTREEILLLHETKDFFKESLPAWQQEVILKGLNMHPELRFQNMQELREALHAKYIPFAVKATNIQAAEISQRIETLIEKKKWVKANTLLEFAHRRYKMSVQLLLVTGRLALLKNNIALASSSYTTALKLNQRTEVQKPLGWIHLASKNYPTAISMLSDFLQRNPHDVEAYNLLLQCYYETGRYEAGIDLANSVKEAGIKNPCIINNAFLCNALLNNGTFIPSNAALKSVENSFLDYNYSVLLESEETHNKSQDGLKNKLLFMDYRFDSIEPNRLTIESNLFEPKVFASQIIKIGREGYDTNDIQIKGGTAISRRHCVILNFKQDIWVYDLNSTGIYQDKKRIVEKVQIIEPSEITIHKTVLKINPDASKLFG